MASTFLRRFLHAFLLLDLYTSAGLAQTGASRTPEASILTIAARLARILGLS